MISALVFYNCYKDAPCVLDHAQQNIVILSQRSMTQPFLRPVAKFRFGKLFIEVKHIWSDLATCPAWQKVNSLYI